MGVSDEQWLAVEFEREETGFYFRIDFADRVTHPVQKSRQTRSDFTPFVAVAFPLFSDAYSFFASTVKNNVEQDASRGSISYSVALRNRRMVHRYHDEVTNLFLLNYQYTI